MELNKIYLGDCIEVLKQFENNSIDAVVTDPPYNLSTIKRFSAKDSGEKWCVKEGVFHRSSKGFMGKEWDNEIAFSPKVWQEIYRVLKPGGYLLSFGGTRTYHRMACAIEDAGFEVRDMVEWIYGSGFPKSLNIGKAVDKLQGNEREVVGDNPNNRPNCDITNTLYETGFRKEKGKECKLTKGTSKWEGWGTALKPAHEPICLARKPLSEKSVAENVLKWKTGGINIDESRVEMKGDKGFWPEKQYGDKDENAQVFKGRGVNPENQLGRFPANLIHDNSPEVRECFPNESERFFKSIIYTAKASKSERNMGCEGLPKSRTIATGRKLTGNPLVDLKHGYGEPCGNNHPTVKPVALMEYLIKMITPKGGIVLDPFAGSGSTLIAAKKNGYQYIGIEKEPEYVKIAEARIKAVQVQQTLLCG